jgi:hypothetical protein
VTPATISEADRAKLLAKYQRLSEGIVGAHVEAPAAGGSSSLASTFQTVPPDDGSEVTYERCPRKVGWRMREVDTGEVFPARCGANSCVWCLPINARERGWAIAYAAPERAMLLTLVGDDWQTIRARMKRLRYDLVEELGRVEWVWHVEPNPAGTGHHVHAWQHGDFLDQSKLSRMAARRGMGEVVRISRVRAAVGSGASMAYGMKLAGLDYGMKEAIALGDQARRYLDANGQRLHHQSRGYWRHPNGEPIKGAKPAVAAARAARRRGDAGHWVLEREPEDGPDELA